MSILFRANDLFEIVTTITDEARRDAAWKRKDANAQKLIVTTIDKKPLLHIFNCTTSYEMWS